MCQDRSNEAMMHLQKARRFQTTVTANPSSALLLCFTRSTDNNLCAPQDRCPLARLKMRSANEWVRFFRNSKSSEFNYEQRGGGVISNDNALVLG
ncbi:hypothetical protein CDAR_111061 [Caerostris darwini]|uniref:Uncharacterized protein n=1 Tax=Caerostris darwini TaxID=1538125 RepID=A0AAV4SRM6_9ARAC|nr:hypothetical protein CDAR_111061 [Caerostris darwini]